jgi:hypothetical protein
MSMQFWTRSFTALTVMSGLILVGCGKSSPDGNSAASSQTQQVAASSDDHSGWWCKEHGVPEGECAQCDPTLVAKFKEAGNWCEEHNRPESHCFLCSPARFDKFAARYEAKFGTKPPTPDDLIKK